VEKLNSIKPIKLLRHLLQALPSL